MSPVGIRSPGGDRAAGSGRGPGTGGPGIGRRGAGAHHGVRLTPRGRLVVLVLLLALAGLGVALAAPATDAAPPAGAAQTVVVRPGDSLWSIAAHYRPGRDTRAVVERIRSLNGISGYTIHAGQRLILPKPS